MSATTQNKGKKGGKQLPDFNKNNSAAKHDTSRREVTGTKHLKHHNDAETKYHLGEGTSSIPYTIPDSYELPVPVERVILVPCTTVGFGCATAAWWTRFRNDFNQGMCTIQQFYRVLLAHFDMHRSNIKYSVSVYPPYRHFGFDFPSAWSKKIENNTSGVRIFIAMTEIYGSFVANNKKHVCYIPQDIPRECPFTTTFFNLEHVVNYWSRHPGLMACNTLPGAVFVNGLLANPNDFWPLNYGPNDLLDDFLAVDNILEQLRTKFDKLLGDYSYDGLGKPAVLVTTDKLVSCPYEAASSKQPVQVTVEHMNIFKTPQGKALIAKADKGKTRAPPKRTRAETSSSECETEFPPVASSSEQAAEQLPPVPRYRNRMPATDEQGFWTKEPLSPQQFLIGAFSLFGYRPDQFLVAHPRYNFRTLFDNTESLVEDWISIFTGLTPLVRRGGQM